jgi:hypothetical protein
MAEDGKLFSITVAHSFESKGETKTKFRQGGFGCPFLCAAIRERTGVSFTTDALLCLDPSDSSCRTAAPFALRKEKKPRLAGALFL